MPKTFYDLVKFIPGIKELVIMFTILLGIIAVSSGLYLLRQVKQRDQLIMKVTENYQPSISILEQLTDKFVESRKLVTYLNEIPPGSDSVLRTEFDDLFHSVIPWISSELNRMSANWDEEDQRLMQETLRLISDSLYFEYLGMITLPGNIEVVNETYAAQANLPFLVSEIEQYLTYLTNKRKEEVEGIFTEITRRSHNLNRNILIIPVVFSILLMAFVVIIYRHLGRSFRSLRQNLFELSNGRIPQPMKVPRRSEFTVVTHNLNSLFSYLRTLTAVSGRILNKDFTSDFKPLSLEDELGNALVNLQENQRKAIEEEQKRKDEDEQRKWTSDSIARINDILRASGNDLTELGYELIESLVELTGSCIGGLFVLNNEDPANIFTEMVAAYAYDRRKQMQKRMGINEGLIGRCIIEKETIYITDVPQGYIRVKTGLGESDPRSLLIVPLHLNGSIYGVLELASFGPYQDHIIRFTETAGENIATSLSKVMVNLRTASLLEQTRQQAEEMSAQEEEMRQKMEELRAIQEDSAQRENKLLKEISDLRKRLLKPVTH